MGVNNMDDNKQVEEPKEKTKLQLKTNDELWNRVLTFKMDTGMNNNNEAVEALIKRGLDPLKALQDKLFPEGKPTQEIIDAIEKFKSNIPIIEKKEFVPLIILLDKKSGAFYCECHIYAKDFVVLSDTNAVINDKEEQAEYRANRELDREDFYFLQMVEDAEAGRQFSDLVIEYNTSYTPFRPLKILGGQHRNEAIIQALKKGVNAVHGIKVYFGLSQDKRAEIMRISNTNINVSPDLRDRIDEQKLLPAGMLRIFCYRTGILNEKDKEDLGDKKRYEDFAPTVRMMRSFIVNFFRGKTHQGEVDKGTEIPYLCISGKKTDVEYLKIFDAFKEAKEFNDPQLIEAGKMFYKLHETQFKNAEKLKGAAKKEYKLKAFSLAIITSWAFAAGALQSQPERLNKLYKLPDVSGTDDPLNAVAMSKARYEKDLPTYRGLATRSDETERGRVLQLFLEYSKLPIEKITLDLCRGAIEMFESNQLKKSAERKFKTAPIA